MSFRMAKTVNVEDNIKACQQLIEKHRTEMHRQEGALTIFIRLKELGITVINGETETGSRTTESQTPETE